MLYLMLSFTSVHLTSGNNIFGRDFVDSRLARTSGFDLRLSFIS